MKKIFFLLFVNLICCLKISAQQNSIAMYFGGSREKDLFFTEDSVGNYTSHPVFPYREDVGLYFLHEVKNNWGYKTGIEFGHINDSYKYPIDSFPLIHHATQGEYGFCPCRPYDLKKELYEISIPFYVTRTFMLGNRFTFLPDAGFSLKFNIRDNYLAHYYLVDSTGITDGGPFTFYRTSITTSNLFIPDCLFFAAHVAGLVRLTDRISISASAGIKFPISGNYHLHDTTISFPSYHPKFPVQVGLVYRIISP